MIREYTKPLHLNGLHDELLIAHPELVETMTVEGREAVDDDGNDWCCLTLPDDTPQATLDSIEAIVSAHDKVAAEAEREQPATNEAQMRQAVRDAFTEMAALEAKMLDGTATTADLRKLLFLCSRNLRRLAKVVFGERDQAV
jgi:hypothetical protein